MKEIPPNTILICDSFYLETAYPRCDVFKCVHIARGAFYTPYTSALKFKTEEMVHYASLLSHVPNSWKLSVNSDPDAVIKAVFMAPHLSNPIR